VPLDALASSDVLEDVHRSAQRSCLVTDHLNIDHDRHTEAVRAFDNHFYVALRQFHTQSIGHGRRGMGHQGAIGIEESEGPAEPQLSIAACRRPAPDLRGSAIEITDNSSSVADIHRHRQEIEEVLGKGWKR